MRPFFGEEEKRAICEYMDEDGFITEFKRTKIFEEMISNFTGAKYCVVVNNGTISLTLAAIASGLKNGDEVIIPNYTMIATPNSIQLFGAKPVFVDVDPVTLCLNIEDVEKAITPKTKAIILVSANGRYPVCGIAAFEKLASDNNLVLIEDAAQSLGSYYPDGRHIGRAGLAGSFSFSAPKIISTGQGGAIITDDAQIASHLKRLKDFGRASGGNDIHDTIGYNFKFTELQACIGIEQMKKLSDRIIRKKEIWERYNSNLSSIDQISLFKHNLKFTAPWFIDSIAYDRDGLEAYLMENNIGSRRMYPPINKQKAYQLPGDFPVSNHIGTNGLWLPSSVQISDDAIDRICDVIGSFYN